MLLWESRSAQQQLIKSIRPRTEQVGGSPPWKARVAWYSGLLYGLLSSSQQLQGTSWTNHVYLGQQHKKFFTRRSSRMSKTSVRISVLDQTTKGHDLSTATSQETSMLQFLLYFILLCAVPLHIEDLNIHSLCSNNSNNFVKVSSQLRHQGFVLNTMTKYLKPLQQK